MSTILVLPWCPVARSYSAGRFAIIPWSKGGEIPGLDRKALANVEAALSGFRRPEGDAVHRAALINYRGTLQLDSLSDEDLGDLSEYLDIFAFSALAGRTLLGAGAYCNTACFTMYSRPLIGDGTGGTFRIRRRDGWAYTEWPGAFVQAPLEVWVLQEVRADEGLLAGLIHQKETLPSQEWVRWLDAIRCFNRAQGDQDPEFSEWVLLCAAFHRVLREYRGEPLGQQFVKALRPEKEVLLKDAERSAPHWKSQGWPVRRQWIKEFSQLRDDFGHGRLVSEKRTGWTAQEHMVLGTIAFPLLVKYLLAEEGAYEILDGDRDRLNAFERLAASKDFMTQPRAGNPGRESLWSEILREEAMERASRQFREAMHRGGDEGSPLEG